MIIPDSTPNGFTYIDLFAGAGGLSEGFASCGFIPVAHVEMNASACDTLKTRACYWWLKHNNQLTIYKQYLAGEITRDELYRSVPSEVIASVICEKMGDDTMPGILERIDRCINSTVTKRVDLIVGGPPCQAYSLVGRGRKDMSSDPRNTLYKQYLSVLKRYEPQMFVFENVPGLLNAGKGKYFIDIQMAFEELGYYIDHKILNAADFGVLQNRKRVILVGWKHGTGFQYPIPRKEHSKAFVQSLFEDLPPLTPGEQCNQYKTSHINSYLHDTGIRKEDDILTWHVARPNRESDREIYRIAINKWTNESKRLLYNELPDALKTHNNRTAFVDRFKVVEKDQPASHTMVAHISKDGHYYIHPDINQARSISVREAARIQSFPDDFFFEGSRTAVFTQIGNAVPPLLAQAIAAAVLKEFREALQNGKND